MPSSTPKQAKFMRAVAHNPKFAKKVDVPQSVGKEFANADAQCKHEGKETPAYEAKEHSKSYLIKALRAKA